MGDRPYPAHAGGNQPVPVYIHDIDIIYAEKDHVGFL